MGIYKKFRSVNEPDLGGLTSRYDQPSYISFRLMFAQNLDVTYNDAGKLTNRTLNYDIMPHPLFGTRGDDDVNNRETYSAIDYLLDANEFTRAEMLKEFITKFNELQTNFQWYFKSIEGIEDILKIKTDYGQRVSSEKRLIINTLEGVDLRMSHLLNLYRKIAWDDTYQRWVLPEMMRYFTLKIYITEFRTFHQAKPSEQTTHVTTDDMVLTILDDILPTWIIQCEMCEFDIESLKFNYLSTLDVSETPQEAATTFSIKVGKIHETQIYPLFRNAYLIDKSLNGADRLKPLETLGLAMIPFDSTVAGMNNNITKNLYAGRIGQNSIGDSVVENSHISGMPFNQNANSTTLIDSANTSKNTWISNAVKSGVALATNYANEWVDKLKMTPIPGLGASVTEMGAALESKNIFTAIGMVRKAVKTATDELIDPSEKLSEEIVDSGFTAFLETIANSVATSGIPLDLTYAAGIALNDKGVWEALKDFSKATDLVGQGEVNSLTKIKDPNIYKELMISNSNGDRSTATDLDGAPKPITDTLPPTTIGSTSTTNKLIL